MTKLTLDIIRSYGFRERIYKPDWDDTAIECTTSNSIKLTGFTQLNNTPCETTSLEGFDGFLYIETKEELDSMLALSFEEVLHEIKHKHPKFPIEEHI